MNFLQDLLGAVQTWFQQKSLVEEMKVKMADDLQRRRLQEEERQHLQREREFQRLQGVHTAAEAHIRSQANIVYNKILSRIIQMLNFGLASVKGVKTPEERREMVRQVVNNMNNIIQSIEKEVENEMFAIEPHLEYIFGGDVAFNDPRFLALRSYIQSERVNVVNRLRQAVNEQVQNFLNQEALAQFATQPPTPTEEAKAAANLFLKQERDRALGFVREEPPKPTPQKSTQPQTPQKPAQPQVKKPAGSQPKQPQTPTQKTTTATQRGGGRR